MGGRLPRLAALIALSRPVRARRDLLRIAAHPPEMPEPMEAIFADFEETILPGITHWQHPRFFAYFPANAAPASVIAEYLVSAIAAQCMLWQTSPAATELETRMLDWLRQAVGFAGSLRRRHPGLGVDRDPGRGRDDARARFAVAGQPARIGRPRPPFASTVRSRCTPRSTARSGSPASVRSTSCAIPVTGAAARMDVEALEVAINRDREAGLLPAGVIACVGGTSVGAIG